MLENIALTISKFSKKESQFLSDFRFPLFLLYFSYLNIFSRYTAAWTKQSMKFARCAWHEKQSFTLEEVYDCFATDRARFDYEKKSQMRLGGVQALLHICAWSFLVWRYNLCKWGNEIYRKDSILHLNYRRKIIINLLRE